MTTSIHIGKHADDQLGGNCLLVRLALTSCSADLWIVTAAGLTPHLAIVCERPHTVKVGYHQSETSGPIPTT